MLRTGQCSKAEQTIWHTSAVDVLGFAFSGGQVFLYASVSLWWMFLVPSSAGISPCLRASVVEVGLPARFSVTLPPSDQKRGGRFEGMALQIDAAGPAFILVQFFSDSCLG